MISRKPSVVTCLMLASFGCHLGHGLVTRHRQPSMIRPAISRRIRKQPSPISMYVDDILPNTSINIPSLSSISISMSACDAPIPTIPLTTSLISKPSNLFSATSHLISSNPRLEAELLSDVSHVALDFTTFISPNTAWLRFCNVLGRVLILSSDYIQDDYIAPDECFFQALMLAVSTHMFLRSAWPLILAYFSSTALTIRDRRAYTHLFYVVGLTVLQFRTLLASRTLEWIEVSPKEKVELNGEYVYWLYSGEACGNKNHIDEDPGDSSKRDCRFSRIYGEVHFAKALEASMYGNKNKDINKKTTTAASSGHGTVVAGSDGAIFLRISTSKLLDLMKNDDQLAGSIHRLVLLCMQEKLSKAFSQGGLPAPSHRNRKSSIYHPSLYPRIYNYNITNASVANK